MPLRQFRGRLQRLAVRQHQSHAAKAVWGGRTGGACASRVRVWASRSNDWWNHSVWETVFGATPKTATGTGALPNAAGLWLEPAIFAPIQHCPAIAR